MTKFFSMSVLAIVLSGCVVSLVAEPVYTNTYYTPQHCRWVEIPVYGYADVYRGNGVWVRLRQVAYVDRQWRCN